MRTKPIYTLAVFATVLVGWLSLRMWCGYVPTVWYVSCVLGAWAPLIGAVVFLFVASVADRENNVAAAWLVRAIGMHCVLLWMIGMADLIHGPPGAHGRDSDVFAPLLLISFAPVLFACVGTLKWGQRVARELGVRFSGLRPAMPGETHARGVPFRGLRLVLEPNRSLPAPRAVWTLGLAGLVAAWASASWLGPVACALMLAPMVVRNPRAFVPAVLLVPATAGVALSAFASRVGVPAFSVMLWMPVVMVGTALVHLGAVELSLSARPAAQKS